MSSLRQSNKTLENLTQRHLRFAELLAEGNKSKADCMRLAGFSDAMARDSSYIGPSRERSKYPALWDYFQKLRQKRLRLSDDNAEAIRRELQIIAFSKITDFVHIPTRNDLERQALLDARIRQMHGYQDAEDDEILSRADKILAEQIVGEPKRLKAEREANLLPGSTVKIKCLDDIPDELIPAIASLAETKDGIRLRLWDKLTALEMLAKINRMFDDPEDGSKKPTVIEKLNVIVNGTKSDLLNNLDL